MVSFIILKLLRVAGIYFIQKIPKPMADDNYQHDIQYKIIATKSQKHKETRNFQSQINTNPLNNAILKPPLWEGVWGRLLLITPPPPRQPGKPVYKHRT
jgi:hypothetical protein